MLGGDSEKTQTNHESWQIVINQCWNAVHRIYLVQLAFSTLSSFVWRGCSTSWIIEIFHVTVVVSEFRNLNDNLWMTSCLCIQRKIHNLYTVNLEWQWAASKSIKWIKRFSCIYIIQTYGIHAHTYMPQINVHVTQFYKKDKQLNCKWFVLLNLQCILSMILFFVLSCQLLWHGHPVEFGDLCTKLHLLMSASAWQRDIWHCRGSRKKKRMQRSRYRQGISGFLHMLQMSGAFESKIKVCMKRNRSSFGNGWASCLQNFHRINFGNCLRRLMDIEVKTALKCFEYVHPPKAQWTGLSVYVRWPMTRGNWIVIDIWGSNYRQECERVQAALEELTVGLLRGANQLLDMEVLYSSYLVMMCFDIIDSDLWHA